MSAAELSYSKRRRAEEVIRNIALGKISASIPSGFPRGPVYANDDAGLAHYVRSWAADVELGGGGWMTKKDSATKYPKSHGAVVQVACTHPGCKWRTWWEEALEGWVLTNYTPHDGAAARPDGSPFANGHNHELEQSQATMAATKAGRPIDPRLIEVAHINFRAGIAVGEVLAVMKSHADSLGVAKDFTYKDVYDLRQFSATDALDAQGLHDYLTQRKEEQDLAYHGRTDDLNRLNRVFCELAGARDEWARGGTENVVLFDPTWGSNKFNLKLCCFTTTGSTGKTVILAFAILGSESEEMFEWAFRCFHDTFNVAPVCLFSDGDQAIAKAMEKAIADFWPQTKHFLCVFHISQNLYKHIRPLFADNVKGWQTFNGMFWEFAKCSDLKRVETVAEDWGALVSFLEANTTESMNRSAQVGPPSPPPPHPTTVSRPLTHRLRHRSLGSKVWATSVSSLRLAMYGKPARLAFTQRSVLRRYTLR